MSSPVIVPKGDAGLEEEEKNRVPEGRHLCDLQIPFAPLGVGLFSSIMPSYTRLIYHIVFATKGRRPTLALDRRRDFLAYCTGVIRGMNCYLYRINCREDHMHTLVAFPPTLDVSTFVQRLKLSSGNWLRDQPEFSAFDRWQEKYGAFTVFWEGRLRLVEYIANQDEHHKKETFAEEFQRLLKEAGLEWDVRDEE